MSNLFLKVKYSLKEDKDKQNREYRRKDICRIFKHCEPFKEYRKKSAYYTHFLVRETIMVPLIIM